MFFGSIKRDRGPSYSPSACGSPAAGAVNTNLGTFTVDPNQMMYSGMTQPRLLLAGEQLFVDSHIGVLAHLDAGRGTLHWAFTYDQTPPTDYWNYYYRPPVNAAARSLLVDGMLYRVGVKSSRLYAYRLTVRHSHGSGDQSEDALVAMDGEHVPGRRR